MFDSDQLEAFRVFAQHLRFTSAATELGITQPALHAKVGRLAAAMGTPLYVRRGRNLALTPRGERVLAHARECHDRDQAFRERLHGGRRQAALVMAAGQGALLYLLRPVLEGWEGPPLRVLRRSAPEAIQAVRDGLAHVGLSAGLLAPPDLTARELHHSHQQVVVTRQHPLADRRQLSPGDLDGVPLILPPRGSRMRDAVEGALSGAGARVEVRVESHGWPVMLHLASLGLGAALVNDICPAPEGCVAIPVSGLPTVRYFALRRNTERDHDALRLFEGVAGTGPVTNP